MPRPRRDPHHDTSSAPRIARRSLPRDLDQTIAWGDERYLRFRGLVDNLVAIRGLEPPALDDPQPLTASAPNSIDLADIGSVIFAAGFRPDYRSWLPWPDAFDAWGFPLTQDGASTVVPRLYFIGVHFVRNGNPHC